MKVVEEERREGEVGRTGGEERWGRQVGWTNGKDRREGQVGREWMKSKDLLPGGVRGEVRVTYPAFAGCVELYGGVVGRH